MPSLSEPVGRFYSLVPNDSPLDDPLNNPYERGQSVHIPSMYGLVDRIIILVKFGINQGIDGSCEVCKYVHSLCQYYGQPRPTYEYFHFKQVRWYYWDSVEPLPG